MSDSFSVKSISEDRGGRHGWSFVLFRRVHDGARFRSERVDELGWIDLQASEGERSAFMAVVPGRLSRRGVPGAEAATLRERIARLVWLGVERPSVWKPFRPRPRKLDDEGK